MTEIASGALCTVRQTGAQLWVVVGLADDQTRWRLKSKGTGPRGGSVVTSRVVGAGDVVSVVREPFIFEQNSVIEVAGHSYEVVAVGDDSVQLLAHTGRQYCVDKFDLTLDLLQAELLPLSSVETTHQHQQYLRG